MSQQKIQKARRTCDLDAFLCNNELSFAEVTFPELVSVRLQAPNTHTSPRQVSERDLFLMEPQSSGIDSLDHMLSEIINFSMEMTPPNSIMTVKTGPSDVEIMEKIMDDMINSFLQNPVISSSPETTNLYIEQIGNHGRSLLAKEENKNPTRARLARRLTSIQPYTQHDLHHSMARHPVSQTIFKDNVDMCLYNRVFDETLISKECSRSLKDIIEESMTGSYSYDISYDPLSIVTFSSLFFFSMTTLFLLTNFFVRSNAHRGRHLKRSILRAVFQKPHIREKIEEELGEGIGHLSHSIGRRPSFLDRFCFSLPLCSLTILLCYVSLTSPAVVTLVGAPVVILLGLYNLCKCILGDDGHEETCDKCDVETENICEDCHACFNCCEHVENDVGKSDEAVYVAVPAVI